jgi:iron complex outermembrane recepter protein
MQAFRKARLSLVIGSLVGAVSSNGWAQGAGSLLEEVIVTAQKREQNLQDVGVSVSAFSGELVRNLGWNSTEDIAVQTPGLMATSFSGDSSVSTFSIRGVGQNDFADHQEAPTAMYVDNVYIANTGAAGMQMFDVKRVEVLRGPQGTLFGRNATGGLIHVLTEDPAEEIEGYIDLTVADYNQTRLEGAVSGPLSDTVSARLAVLKDDADGYFKNANGDDVRDRDLLSLRAKLRFTPTDTITVDLAAWSNQVDKNLGGAYDFIVSHEEANDAGSDFQGVANNYPKPNEGFQNPVGMIDKDAVGYTGVLTWEFDTFALTSITDFQDFEKFYLEDSDGNESRTLEYFSDQESKQFSQELRLNGQTGDTTWVAGFYYLNIDGDFESSINMPTFGGNTINNYSLETTSWSIFGQVEHSLTQRLSVIAGLRYIEDEKEYEIDSRCAPAFTHEEGEIIPPFDAPNDCSWFSSGVPGAPVIVEVEQPYQDKRDDSDYSGTLRLDYQLSDDTLLYGSVSRGLKAGGYTAPLDGFLVEEQLPFEPEVLNAYEVGFKSEFFDGLMRLNGSGFYYDYEDFQAFVFQGLTSVVVNHDANIVGAELELIANPMEGLEISAGLSALDATVEDVEIAEGVFADQDMITAPDLTANLMVRKSWELSSGALIAQLDGYYVDDQQFNTVNTALTLGDSYSVWNARLTYQAMHGDNNWQVTAFAKNFGDEEYLTYAFDLSGFGGYSLQVYGPPSWYGVQAQYSW